MSKVNNPEAAPYRAERPNRFTKAYPKYKSYGGLINIEEELKNFLGDRPSDPDLVRFYFFIMAFDQLVKEGIIGDIAEIGVYKGTTAAVLASLAKRIGTTAYLLDTYEGFRAEDLAGVDANRQLQFADTSLAAVRDRVGDGNARYVVGYFPDSAAQMPDDRPFCLVHIDCDLYAPIKSALAYFYPRVLPGGYLIIHDYGSMSWDGAEQAIDEFFADKPEAPIPLADRGGSVVVRKARDLSGGGNWMLRKRASLLRDAWVSAGAGGLHDLTGSGWRPPEPWGVWGIGREQTLHLVMDIAPPEGGILLEMEASAALTAERTALDVALLAGERHLGDWHFGQDRPRGQFSVAVPAEAFSPAGGGYHAAVLRCVCEAPVPTDLKGTTPLTMALHRLRRSR